MHRANGSFDLGTRAMCGYVCTVHTVHVHLRSEHAPNESRANNGSPAALAKYVCVYCVCTVAFRVSLFDPFASAHVHVYYYYPLMRG